MRLFFEDRNYVLVFCIFYSIFFYFEYIVGICQGLLSD